MDPFFFNVLIFLFLILCQTIIWVITFRGIFDERIPLSQYIAAFSKLVDFVGPFCYHVIGFDPTQVLTIAFRLLIEFWNWASPVRYTVTQLFRTIGVPLRSEMPPVAGQPGRMAIITGGATVVFKELLDEVATPKFLRALSDAGFENVLIQCGSYKEELKQKLANLEHEHLNIELQDFVSNMKEAMQGCRGTAGERPGGVVFSHAGTGTIADCWEVNVANVIVANPNLMDNHQAVFAEEMAEEHQTVILGRLGHLHEAVPEAIAVIRSCGLDNVGPAQEPALPVPDDIRLHFIDNLFQV